jgi:copper(I)-binding protein
MFIGAACGAQTITITDAWMRPVAPGQQGTGAFLRITAQEDAKLIGGETPAAGRVEIHSMTMDGDVMRMRELPEGLALPAGRAVELKPGGYHLMLMDLKSAPRKGEQVPLKLTVEFKGARRQTVETMVQVRVPQ